MESAIFIVEGGKALKMVKDHVLERTRVKAVAKSLADELGVDDCYINRFNGTLSGVCFKGKLHPDFTKARGREGVSYPKKGTEWDKKFKAQVGFRELVKWIADEFKIPCGISYKGKDCHGSKIIGSAFNECGFLYLSENGPYAMWTPDVPAEVAAMIAQGYEVEEPANSFVLAFDGCRRIEKEEWEIMVLQHKLDKRKAL